MICLLKIPTTSATRVSSRNTQLFSNRVIHPSLYYRFVPYPLAREVLYVSMKICSLVFYNECQKLQNLGHMKVCARMYSFWKVWCFSKTTVMINFPRVWSCSPLTSATPVEVNRSLFFVSTTSKHWYQVSTGLKVKLFSIPLLLICFVNMKTYVRTAFCLKWGKPQQHILRIKNKGSVPLKLFRTWMLFILLNDSVIDFPKIIFHCRVF